MPKEFFTNQNGLDTEHRFRVLGNNGEIVAQSEAYTRHRDAQRGYKALCDAVRDDVLAGGLYILIQQGLNTGFYETQKACVFTSSEGVIEEAFKIIDTEALQVQYDAEQALAHLLRDGRLMLTDIDAEGSTLVLIKAT